MIEFASVTTIRCIPGNIESISTLVRSNNLRLSNEHIGYGFVKNINLVPELTINQSAGEVSEILKKIITTKFI